MLAAAAREVLEPCCPSLRARRDLREAEVLREEEEEEGGKGGPILEEEEEVEVEEEEEEEEEDELEIGIAVSCSFFSEGAATLLS